MSRPKHENPEHFTSGEISHGTGISVRNLQLLRDNSVAPQAVKNASGNSTSLYGLDGVIHFAMVGALHLSGMALMESAKLAQQLKWEFNDFQFGYMSGIGRSTFGREVDFSVPAGGDAAFWLHHGLHKESNRKYRSGLAWDDDIVLVVADRKFAFLDVNVRRNKAKRVFGFHIVEAGPEPFCQILENHEGAKIAVQPVYERDEWETSDGQLEILDEYTHALANAIGLTRVNLSLAIRNCADQIHDLRMEKGGKIFS